MRMSEGGIGTPLWWAVTVKVSSEKEGPGKEKRGRRVCQRMLELETMEEMLDSGYSRAR